ncbi:hypothetical protein RhiirA1_540022 [Rhizophagus irregularis]|uniref:Uncharacterized protein n=2 Tax=Rhizophagus irregularis TaxID=588596 RepID=A0A2I1DTV4_9GLOM|nr:hypothetical protein GLOIN_2v1780572 [Rhizophagus irregularis DAOM 181602=DAOM 197198]PKC60175.1 hypothetical protein RhiirA1_540022 [Rhizophagus irregularis]PKY13302.1 hypothetical protein RhiirB3_518689 [Rhizophagus irregularis]POG66418.1 hypothetical protein GLOIN_2v1780572 [Rhizophagus irregularis DAOM 181602=DAOM 197198]|eukprot:XP_025173284.1 hypothetical protein GLOIN_2v1780572 [Rhizophagus irregularis DAOM 181602=DAOM 197198]
MKECVKVKENYGEKYKDFRLSKRFGNLLKRVEKGDEALRWFIEFECLSAQNENEIERKNEDGKKAFELFMKSAIGGYSKGQCVVGFYYSNGIGTQQDYEKAMVFKIGQKWGCDGA